MSIFVKRRPYLGLIITILSITLIYVPYQNLNSRAQAAVDCNANPSDPACGTPGVDCTANPNDPACAPAATPTPPPPTPAPSPGLTSGCGPGTDNSTCSTTAPSPQPTQSTPTAGCGPGTDNSTCSTTAPSSQAPAAAPSTNTTAPSNITAAAPSTNPADFVNSILAAHNRERAAVGVPPLVWNNTAAAHAKAWVEYLAAGKTGGKINHCFQLPESERTDACPEKHHEGENLAVLVGPDSIAGPAQLAQASIWLNEKPILHYLAVVSNTSISVGCGIATGMTPLLANYHIMSCRYYPQCGAECGAAGYVRGIEYFDKLLAIDPHDVHALNGKGAALDVLGNHTGAKEYYDKAKAIKSAAGS